jgi:hypothetical protein
LVAALAIAPGAKDEKPCTPALAGVRERRDEEMIQTLFEAEKEFWNCVLKGKPPI